MAINDGDTAFPIPGGGAISIGMSLRDYFAAKAMHAIYTRLGGSPACGDVQELAHLATQAYAAADAMLAVRAKDSAQ